MTMRVSVTDAKGQLTDLIRRAEGGEEVLLTRHGQVTVQLVPVREKAAPRDRRRLLETLRRQAQKVVTPGPNAARSQDGLYDDNGLPK